MVIRLWEKSHKESSDLIRRIRRFKDRYSEADQAYWTDYISEGLLQLSACLKMKKVEKKRIQRCS